MKLSRDFGLAELKDQTISIRIAGVDAPEVSPHLPAINPFHPLLTLVTDTSLS